ncbi:hypothetical protein K438DRAFT_1877561 [Mycena galopus ATCC 62051]|nr:hypothetical protein K438DRAFT_1877561 [Mycena galopus ATCC 62051]
MHPRQPLRVRTDWSTDNTSLHTRSSAAPRSRIPHDSHAPRQFIPYLYLFSHPLPGAPLPPGTWTHTLRLLPATKSRPAGSTDIVGTGGVRGLDLYLPPAVFKAHSRPLPLHQSTNQQQLLLARDFLALALPYYASAHPPETPLDSSGGCGWPSSSSAYAPITHAPLQGGLGFGGMMSGMMTPQVPRNSQADPVRVLVLGPPRLVLAIGLLYLAYASGCTMKQVMRGVLEGDADRDAEWRKMIAEDGQLGLGKEDMKMLERLAVEDL